MAKLINGTEISKSICDEMKKILTTIRADNKQFSVGLAIVQVYIVYNNNYVVVEGWRS